MTQDPDPILVARTPYADLRIGSRESDGCIVTERDGLGLATVLVRKGHNAALAQRVQERFGIGLPQEPRRDAARGVAFSGIGPGTWLATSEQGGNAFAASLRESIGDLASVSDQSDGYAVLRLSGPNVHNILCKLVPIDLHPRAFKIGHVAATVAAHIGATLSRLADDADGSSVFEIAIYRSFATSFCHALTCIRR